ncbi:MAG: dihydrofolate reductase family protein [Deltaproteobacteria bacterium]
MRTLDYYVATSIDGRIAADDGSFDHFLFDEKHVHDFFADLEAYGTVVMGRATYEVGLAAGKTNPYPWLETVVYSKSLGASPDEAVRVVADDAVESVRALKAEDGKPIWLCGGSKLAASLYEADLIDRLIVKINPVLSGGGMSLVGASGETKRYALVRQQTYASGIVVLTEERALAH